MTPAGLVCTKHVCAQSASFRHVSFTSVLERGGLAPATHRSPDSCFLVPLPPACPARLCPLECGGILGSLSGEGTGLRWKRHRKKDASSVGRPLLELVLVTSVSPCSWVLAHAIFNFFFFLHFAIFICKGVESSDETSERKRGMCMHPKHLQPRSDAPRTSASPARGRKATELTVSDTR